MNLALCPRGGNVGIGEHEENGIISPASQLHIKQHDAPYGTDAGGSISNMPDVGLKISFSVGIIDEYWGIYAGFGNTDPNNGGGLTSPDYTRLYFNNKGAHIGWLNATSQDALDFTGQHRCILNKNLDETSKGLIVSSTGKYININNSLNTNINESLPICNITNTDNDKKVFGVISDKEDNNSNRNYSTGNFVSCYAKTNKNEQRMFINSVGEGAIWVCNKNGNVENGDYISSSSVAGYGMKQILEEGTLKNFTVAKITCDCHFSLTKIVKQKLKVINQSDSSGNAYTDIDYNTNGDVQYEDDLDANGAQQIIFPFETRFLQADATQITEAEYNSKLGTSEEVYIACFVGCTYHCG